MSNQINTKIIKLRKSVGWSQSELARQSGVTSAAISQLEKGSRKPSLNVIAKIANALGVSILDFTDDETIDLAADKVFLRKFGFIRKLSEGDQELLLELGKRLLK